MSGRLAGSIAVLLLGAAALSGCGTGAGRTRPEPFDQPLRIPEVASYDLGDLVADGRGRRDAVRRGSQVARRLTLITLPEARTIAKGLTQTPSANGEGVPNRPSALESPCVPR